MTVMLLLLLRAKALALAGVGGSFSGAAHFGVRLYVHFTGSCCASKARKLQALLAPLSESGHMLPWSQAPHSLLQ